MQNSFDNLQRSLELTFEYQKYIFRMLQILFVLSFVSYIPQGRARTKVFKKQFTGRKLIFKICLIREIPFGQSSCANNHRKNHYESVSSIIGRLKNLSESFYCLRDNENAPDERENFSVLSLT